MILSPLRGFVYFQRFHLAPCRFSGPNDHRGSESTESSTEKIHLVVSGTRSRCCNACPTNHPAPSMGDPLCPLCLCGSDYSESLQGIGLRCVGAGYIPPLSVDVPLNAQGRHICRPYSTLASSVVGARGLSPPERRRRDRYIAWGVSLQERQQSKNHKAAERRQKDALVGRTYFRGNFPPTTRFTKRPGSITVSTLTPLMMASCSTSAFDGYRRTNSVRSMLRGSLTTSMVAGETSR